MTKYTVLGDIHIGNKEAHRASFRYAMKKAEKIILMGDIIEGFTKKDKRHSKDTILDYSEQITEAIRDIKPYRKKVVRFFEGNHESSLFSKMDIDSMKLICGPLKIEKSNTEILNLDGIDCFFTHGSGMGATYGASVTKLINYAKDHSAKYYFMGHSHKLFDMEIQHNPNTYTIVNTGTFLEEAEYAVRMGYPKSIMGYYILDTVSNTLEKKVVK